MRETEIRILQAIRFFCFVFLFRDDLFTRGQPPISVTGHWRIHSYVYTYLHIQSLNDALRPILSSLVRSQRVFKIKICSSGVILVKISSFLNPEGRDAAGTCCNRYNSTCVQSTNISVSTITSNNRIRKKFGRDQNQHIKLTLKDQNHSKLNFISNTGEKLEYYSVKQSKMPRASRTIRI